MSPGLIQPPFFISHLASSFSHLTLLLFYVLVAFAVGSSHLYFCHPRLLKLSINAKMDAGIDPQMYKTRYSNTSFDNFLVSGS